MKTKESPGMLFFNTFEIISRSLARKITQIGLNFAEIDTLTRKLYFVLTEFLRTYDFPIYQKEISLGI